MLQDVYALSPVKALSNASFDFEFGTVHTFENEPLGEGIFNIGYGGSTASPSLKVCPFGQGQEGQQFQMRIYAMSALGTDPRTWVWHRTIIAEMVCTLGRQAGFANRVVETFERFAGEIAVTYGLANIYPAPDGGIACAVIPTLGCQKAQFEFANEDPALPIGMNSLWTRASPF